MSGIIDTRTDLDRVGDEVDDWDSWLDGQISIDELPEYLQVRARAFIGLDSPESTVKSVVVVKHGSHNQKDHGRRGSGYEEWGDRAAEIEAAGNGRMTVDEIDGYLALADFDAFTQQYVDDARNSGRWDELVDEEVAMGATREEAEDAVRQGLEDEAVQAHDDALEYNDSLTASMDTVFGGSYVGMDGRAYEFRVEDSVIDPGGAFNGGPSLNCSGAVYDENGAQVGEFQRSISRSGENGELTVSHDLFVLDPEIQGQGIGSQFFRDTENYYINRGFAHIEVHANIDVGGYAWARAGYGWDTRRDTADAAGRVRRRVSIAAADARASGDIDLARSLESLDARMVAGSVRQASFPSPQEVMSVGYVRGASTWPGKGIMLGSDWYGVKPLTPPVAPAPLQDTLF